MTTLLRSFFFSSFLKFSLLILSSELHKPCPCQAVLAPCSLIGLNELVEFWGPECVLECHTHGCVTFKGENMKMTQCNWEQQHEYNPSKPVSSWVAPKLWWMWESVGCYVVEGWGMWNARKPNSESLEHQYEESRPCFVYFSILIGKDNSDFQEKRKRNFSLEMIFIQSLKQSSQK